jgi:hypothetical protein
MNFLDPLAFASDRLVACLQPFASRFENVTRVSAYRLAAFLYRASLFCMIGSTVVSISRRVPFIAELVRLGASPWAFVPKLLQDGIFLAVGLLATIFVDRLVQECRGLADRAEAGGLALGNSMREHPYYRAQSFVLLIITARDGWWLFHLSPDLLGRFRDFAHVLWPIVAVLACHVQACRSLPPSRSTMLRPILA